MYLSPCRFHLVSSPRPPGMNWHFCHLKLVRKWGTIISFFIFVLLLGHLYAGLEPTTTVVPVAICMLTSTPWPKALSSQDRNNPGTTHLYMWRSSVVWGWQEEPPPILVRDGSLELQPGNLQASSHSGWSIASSVVEYLLKVYKALGLIPSTIHTNTHTCTTITDNTRSPNLPPSTSWNGKNSGIYFKKTWVLDQNCQSDLGRVT